MKQSYDDIVITNAINKLGLKVDTYIDHLANSIKMPVIAKKSFMIKENIYINEGTILYIDKIYSTGNVKNNKLPITVLFKFPDYDPDDNKGHRLDFEHCDAVISDETYEITLKSKNSEFETVLNNVIEKPAESAGKTMMDYYNAAADIESSMVNYDNTKTDTALGFGVVSAFAFVLAFALGLSELINRVVVEDAPENIMLIGAIISAIVFIVCGIVSFINTKARYDKTKEYKDKIENVSCLYNSIVTIEKQHIEKYNKTEKGTNV